MSKKMLKGNTWQKRPDYRPNKKSNLKLKRNMRTMKLNSKLIESNKNV